MAPGYRAGVRAVDGPEVRRPLAHAYAPAMLVVYLAFNAVLYVVFAAWCALAPAQTSRFLGLTLVGAPGQSEYYAVYGGLQAALAAVYGLALFAPAHRPTVVLFSLVLYAGLVAFRSIAIVRFGFGALGNARSTYGLEWALLIGALVLVLRGAGR